MRRLRDRVAGGAPDQADLILWAIVDGQAAPGSHRRVLRLLGASRDAKRVALGERSALDCRLRAWASPEALPVQKAGQPAHSPLPARIADEALQRAAVPSAVLAGGLFLAALGFQLHALNAGVKALVEGWRGLL